MVENKGAWIPWAIADCLPRLKLRPPSRWQVFTVVLVTWCRYGRHEARMSIKDICKATGLAKRTVQGALADLVSLGLLQRIGRQGRLIVVPEALTALVNVESAVPVNEPSTEVVDTPGLPFTDVSPGATTRASRRRTHRCASLTSIDVPKKRNSERRPSFTRKQLTVIGDVMAEAAELLVGDPAELSMPARFAEDLDFPCGATYGSAMKVLITKGTHRQAIGFTAAVLALRNDVRVQGYELGVSETEASSGMG